MSPNPLQMRPQWFGPQLSKATTRRTVVTSGDLTLVANLEAALGGDEIAASPPVIVAVGGASVSDLRTLLDRILAHRPVASVRPVPQELLVEGRLERRLGVAGSDAEIRLEVTLPAPHDPMRSCHRSSLGPSAGDPGRRPGRCPEPG